MLHVFVLQVLCNLIDVHGNGVLRVSPGVELIARFQLL